MGRKRKMEELQKLRVEIDQADHDLLAAVARRMELVEQVVQIKNEQGLAIFDAEREHSLFRKLSEKAENLNLDIRLVEKLLRQIVGHSRNVQNSIRSKHQESSASLVKKVSFQGAPGSYSWKAIKRYYQNDPKTTGCSSFGEALDLLAAGEVDRAFLPYQNSIAGSIHEVYAELTNGDFHIVGEEHLFIDHCLIGADQNEVEITDIFSHPVALKQCTKYLETLKNVDVHAYVDTGEAVKKVLEDDNPHYAAIASDAAASYYGMKVIKAGISDHPENVTRFWSISRHPEVQAVNAVAKTSLLLVTGHHEGALVACLQLFAQEGVNMLKLESRPRATEPEEFKFYIDLAGNISDSNIARAIETVRNIAHDLRILGCYPSAE
jgi:chorismate mutase/prephenate dehydratase